ncbi:DUF397 domain-containing protein [Actinomadura scrupuli]|uniref:DUF397 domain-containing protein n=1 Tax=Actinomadura scrupuli TaxID=559629 RepID=UPI003D95EE28
MNEPSPLSWRKSSHSGEDVNTECVEVADLSPVLAVRDSKNPGGPLLTFHRHEFRHLLAQVKSGRLDL